MTLVVENPPASAGDTRDSGSIPGLGRSPGGGHCNPLQYSSGENPMDRGAWQAAVHGVTQSQTQLKRLSSSSINEYIHLYTYLIVTSFSCRPRTDNFLARLQQISFFMKQTLKERASGSRKHILCFRKLLPNPSTVILQTKQNSKQNSER